MGSNPPIKTIPFQVAQPTLHIARYLSSVRPYVAEHAALGRCYFRRSRARGDGLLEDDLDRNFVPPTSSHPRTHHPHPHHSPRPTRDSTRTVDADRKLRRAAAPARAAPYARPCAADQHGLQPPPFTGYTDTPCLASPPQRCSCAQYPHLCSVHRADTVDAVQATLGRLSHPLGIFARGVTSQPIRLAYQGESHNAHNARVDDALLKRSSQPFAWPPSLSSPHASPPVSSPLLDALLPYYLLNLASRQLPVQLPIQQLPVQTELLPQLSSEYFTALDQATPQTAPAPEFVATPPDVRPLEPSQAQPEPRALSADPPRAGTGVLDWQRPLSAPPSKALEPTRDQLALPPACSPPPALPAAIHANTTGLDSLYGLDYWMKAADADMTLCGPSDVTEPFAFPPPLAASFAFAPPLQMMGAREPEPRMDILLGPNLNPFLL